MAEAMTNLNLDSGSLNKVNGQLRAMDKYMTSIEKRANSMNRTGLARQITLVDRLTESVKRLDQALSRIRDKDLFKPATYKLNVQQKVVATLDKGIAALLERLAKGAGTQVQMNSTMIQAVQTPVSIVNQFEPKIEVVCKCEGKKEDKKDWIDYLKDGLDIANSVLDIKEKWPGKKDAKADEGHEKSSKSKVDEASSSRTKEAAEPEKSKPKRNVRRVQTSKGPNKAAQKPNVPAPSEAQKRAISDEGEVVKSLSKPESPALKQESPAAEPKPKGGGGFFSRLKGWAKKGLGGLGKIGKGIFKGAKSVVKFGGKALGPLSTALDVVDLLKGKNSSERGEVLGSMLGGFGGTGLGSAIGTMILPGPGTFIGGALGGLFGGFGGGKLGKTIGGWFSGSGKKIKKIGSSIWSFFTGPKVSEKYEPLFDTFKTASKAAVAGANIGLMPPAVAPSPVKARALTPVTGKGTGNGTQTVQINAVQMNTLGGMIKALKMQTQIHVNVPVGAVQIQVQDQEIDIGAVSQQVSQRLTTEMRRALENRKQMAY